MSIAQIAYLRFQRFQTVFQPWTWPIAFFASSGIQTFSLSA